MSSVSRLYPFFTRYALWICGALFFALVIGSAFALPDSTPDSWPQPNGVVRTIAIGNNGTVYIAGDFTSVGGVARNRAAAFSCTGGLLPWNPNLNSAAYDLAFTGTTVYLAGPSFTTVGGVARQRKAAVSATGTGQVLPWNPWNLNSSAVDVEVYGDRVYIMGLFTAVNGTIARRGAVAFAASNTGTLLPWTPVLSNGLVTTMAFSGSTAYLGGTFTALQGFTRNRAAAVDAFGTGNILPTWNPNANSTVYKLAKSGSTMYMGGIFTTMGGVTRNYYANVTANGTGNLLSWNPNATGTAYPQSLALGPTEIFLAGGFTSVGGVTRNYMAAVSGGTGNLLGWNPNANTWNTYTYNAIAVDGTTTYVGGHFTTIGGVSQTYFARFSTPGGSGSTCGGGGGGGTGSGGLISGTVYTDEGSTGIASGRGVSVSLNGAAAAGNGTTRNGGFFAVSLTGATLARGDVMSVYLDGASEKAVTVTLGSGSSMSGIHLYQNHLIVRSDSGSVALTNAHLGTAKGNGDADITAIYNVDAGNVLQVAADKELYVWAGKTFAPGAEVKVHDMEVKGTMSLGNNLLTVTGSLIANAGTLTTSTGITLGSTSSSTETLNLGSNATQNLTINNGLVGYWRLNEGTGSAVIKDSTGNSTGGTLVNGATWSSSIPPRVQFYDQKSLALSSAGQQYVTLGKPAALETDFITAAAWVYLDSVGGYQYFLARDDLAANRNYDFGTEGAGTMTGYLWNSAGSYANCQGGSLSAKTWYHLAVSYDGAYLRCYLNGAMVNQAALAGTMKKNTAISHLIGRQGSSYMGGLFDDVRIYNRALSASEIEALYNGYQTTGSGVYALGSALDVNGSLRIISGTLSGSTFTSTVSGNFLNVGGFAKGSSTISLDGTGHQTVSGSTVFHNLSATTSATRTIFFDYTGRQSASGSLTLRGTVGNLLSVRSTRSGSGARILLDGDSGTQTIDYLNVKDSIASSGATLVCLTATEGCVDSGNTTNWSFVSSSSAQKNTFYFFGW